MQNRKQNKSQVKTFREWLESQQNLDTPVGDLAKEALQDTGWEGDSSDSLLSRMKRMAACQDALEAFRRAEKQFKKALSN